MATIEIHAQDCPKSFEGYESMACECAEQQPVRANSHISPAASAAAVISSWFVTAHSEIAPMIFRTRVESPVL